MMSTYLQHLPWNEERRLEQMSLVANAMAYVHKSSMVALQRQQIHEKTPRLFYTPNNFAEFVHMFRVVGSQINNFETVSYVIAVNWRITVNYLVLYCYFTKLFITFYLHLKCVQLPFLNLFS